MNERSCVDGQRLIGTQSNGRIGIEEQQKENKKTIEIQSVQESLDGILCRGSQIRIFF